MIEELKIMETFEKIEELLKEQNFTDALSLINSLEEKKLEQPILHYWKLQCLIQLRQYNQALLDLEEALTIDPTNAKTWYMMGVVYERLQNIEKCESAFKRAILLDPSKFESYQMLANLYEQNNDLDQAEEYCQKALKIKPNLPVLKTTLARIYSRRKRYKEALTLYHDSLKTPNPDLSKDDVYFSLGKIYDTINEPKNAFKYFSKGNIVARKKYVQRGFSKEVEWELLKRYKERLKNFKLSQPPHPPLAFLVGFPRSGTTLLERILDTHNEIQVLDEKATLGEVLPLFTNSKNSDHFFKNIFRLRLKYFQEVLDNIEYTPNQLLVDKNPLYLREVGLIHFLFPHAKFIFAVRHPCDTCLSCFMQNFTTTPSLANFTSLEDSIVYYDEIIGLLLEQEKKYSLNIHRIRYEDLVGDFEGEGRKLLNFLNVPWQSDLDQYHKNTKNRVLVQTPSYSQVCRPIYKEARYRWLKYKNYFQPFLPIIQKYIDQFGYSSEG